MQHIMNAITPNRVGLKKPVKKCFDDGVTGAVNERDIEIYLC